MNDGIAASPTPTSTNPNTNTHTNTNGGTVKSNSGGHVLPSSTRRPQYRWEKWTFCNSPPSPRQVSPGRHTVVVGPDGRSTSSFSPSHHSQPLYSDSGWIMEHPVPYSETDSKGGFGLLPPSHAALSSSPAGGFVHTPNPFGQCTCGSAFCSCFSSFSSSPLSGASPRSTPSSSPRSSTSSPRSSSMSSPQGHMTYRAAPSAVGAAQWTVNVPFKPAGSPSPAPVAPTGAAPPKPRRRKTVTTKAERFVLRRSSSAPERDSLFASDNCGFIPASNGSNTSSNVIINNSKNTTNGRNGVDSQQAQQEKTNPMDCTGSEETQNGVGLAGLMTSTPPVAAAGGKDNTGSEPPHASPLVMKFMTVYRDKIWLLFPILPEWLSQANLDQVFSTPEPPHTEISLCLCVAAALGARTSGDMKAADQLLIRALHISEHLLERQQSKPAHQLYWLALGLFGISFYELDPMDMQLSSKYLLMAMKLCEKIEARRSVVYIKCICLLVSHGTPELEESLRGQIMLTLRAIMELPLEHTFPFTTVQVSVEVEKALCFLLKTESLWAFIIDGPQPEETYRRDVFYQQAVKKLDEIEEELKEFEELLFTLADGNPSESKSEAPSQSTSSAAVPSLWSRPFYFDPSITSFILFTTKTLKAECYREMGTANMAVEWAINAFEVAKNDLEYFQPTSLCTLDSLFHIFMQADRRYASALIEVIGVLERRHVAASFIRHKYQTVLEREEEENNRRLHSQAAFGFQHSAPNPNANSYSRLLDGTSDSMSLAPQATFYPPPAGSTHQPHHQHKQHQQQQIHLSQLTQSSMSVPVSQQHFASPQPRSRRAHTYNVPGAVASGKRPPQSSPLGQSAWPQQPLHSSAPVSNIPLRRVYHSQGPPLVPPSAASSPPPPSPSPPTRPAVGPPVIGPGGQKMPPTPISRSQSAPQLLTPNHAAASSLSFISYQQSAAFHHHQHQQQQQQLLQQTSHQHHAGSFLPLGPSTPSPVYMALAMPSMPSSVTQIPPQAGPRVSFDGIELDLSDWTLEDNDVDQCGAINVVLPDDGLMIMEEVKMEEEGYRPTAVAPSHIFNSQGSYHRV